MEKESDHKLSFLDVSLNNNEPSLVTSVFRKSTFTGLFINFFSFTALSYKLAVIRTLIDRIYKIHNTWLGFNKDVNKLKSILESNMYPGNLGIDKILSKYLNNAFNPGNSDNNRDNGHTFHFKIPYVGKYSITALKRIKSLVKRYCNDNLDIRLAFSSFKIGSLFTAKDSITTGLRSNVVCKFLCPSCKASYVGESIRHLATPIRELLVSDRASHIYKHLQTSSKCRDACSTDSFKVLDYANNSIDLKIKEALHIKWERPSINQQLYHVNLKLFV